jgi:two-component system, OmpR family, sensor histidine kinase KdpD
MARGRLRIYLGAAPGVGKTYAMLNEGWRRHTRGTDVVVGLHETHGRSNTEAQVRDLEVVPRRTIEYRQTTFEEMDVDAILARKPEVALVDELAHTNIPGSRHEKRWQDVEDLLDAGIDVVSTLNVQHLESINDVVERITGVKQQETIPDSVVRQAEQVEMVDMTPEAIRRRLAHGNIYPAERVDASLANYFRPGNLAALREIALLWVADRVEENLQQYLEAHGIESTWETRERVVVALTGAPGAETLIRRAARMARRTKGDLIGVHVRPTDGLTSRTSDSLVSHRELLEDLGGAYHEAGGDDVGEALVQFARSERATQLVVGASRRRRWAELFHGSVISRVLRSADTIDVHVIATEAPDPDHMAGTPIRVVRSAISRRRQGIACLLAVAALPLLTAVLTAVRTDVSLPSDLLFYLLVVIGVAAVGGLIPAVLSAIGAFLLANWYFTTPFHTLTVDRDDNLIALIVFVVVAVVVGELVSRVARRRAQASRAQADAETLAALSGTLLSDHDPVPALMAGLRDAFGCESVSVLRRSGDGWRVEASAGDPVPQAPDDAQVSVPLDADTTLAVCGEGIGEEDLQMLRAFVGQLALAVERRRLRAEAAAAEGLAEANHLRTALLAAVSHDLRTPLASIKASVTSLLQPDVTLDAGSTGELLDTIDEETDRLTKLVGNLLDMSRLQTGSFELVWCDVGLEEVVAAALQSLGDTTGRVVVDVPETLPRVRADAALLERAIANVVANALQASPPDRPVRIFAGASAERVELTIVDSGPGIPRSKREEVFQPFQRLGDNPQGTGVGLGLAVARGFVEAMDGELTLDDTPGGGATVAISVPLTR